MQDARYKCRSNDLRRSSPHGMLTHLEILTTACFLLTPDRLQLRVDILIVFVVMSSMRNAVTRRPHKERSQPASRSKWGLLEKHKDYSLRAADYNLKKQKLSQLSRKAKEKHPDEFAYGMLSGDKARQGKHGRGGEENKLSHDAVKLLKTQDQGYLRVAAGRGRRELGRVQEDLGLMRGAKGKKIVFEEPTADVKGKKRNAEGEVLEDIDRNDQVLKDVAGPDTGMTDAETENIPPVKLPAKKQLVAEKDASARLRLQRRRRKKLQEIRVNKLDMLRKRQKDIMAAADQLDLQRAKMAKTIGGTNKSGVTFKVRERKR